MRFRPATDEDHPLMLDRIGGREDAPRSIAQAWVTDNEEGQRYWIAVLPYALGQVRLQTWLERFRGESYPSIFHEL